MRTAIEENQMHCCQYYLATGDGDPSFTIELPQFTFGAGCLAEAGAQAQALGLKRVGLFTDKRVARLPHVETVEQARQGPSQQIVSLAVPTRAKQTRLIDGSAGAAAKELTRLLREEARVL
jgi:alcohol dehydrogenase class IV